MRHVWGGGGLLLPHPAYIVLLYHGTNSTSEVRVYDNLYTLLFCAVFVSAKQFLARCPLFSTKGSLIDWLQSTLKIEYTAVRQCIIAVHPRSRRVRPYTAVHNSCNAVLPVVAPKFADASAGTGTQGTRQEAATDIHKTLFYPGTFVREDKRSIRNQTFMHQF